MTSDLTSLKYGSDRRGGGWSGQPYFRQDPPSRTRSMNFGTSFLGNDFLIRGGVRAVSAVLEDEIRLTNFLTNLRSPNGYLFIAKQKMLSRQAPLTGASPARTYSPLNTLAQAAVNNIGIHYMKQGKTLRIDDNDKYLRKTQTEYNTSELGINNKNKLLLLYENKILTSTTSYTPGSEAPALLDRGRELFNSLKSSNSFKDLFRNTASAIKNIDEAKTNLGIFGISASPDYLFQYIGGPNATLGGKTTIRRLIDQDTNIGVKNNKTSTSGQFLVYTQDLIRNRSKSTTTGFSLDGIQNFEEDFLSPSSQALTGVKKERINQLIGTPTDYTEFNRSKTYGEGDPGKRGRDRSVYYTTNVSNLKKSDPNIFETDQVNAQPLYSSQDESARTGPGYDDIIKFNIGVLDLDSTGETRNTTWIHFRAQLQSFSDNHSAEWNSVKYMGRGNNFYKYNGYRRDISMGFRIVVHSKYEQSILYSKLNYLASVIAPNYSAGGFMRGNIIKLTIGDYLNNTLGILNSINFDIPEESPWDIGRKLDGSEDDNSLQLPQIIDVGNFSFTPIHNFVENVVSRDYVTGEKAIPNQQFISLGAGGRGYKFSQNARAATNGSSIESQS